MTHAQAGCKWTVPYDGSRQGRQLHKKLALSLVEAGIESCLEYLQSVLSTIAGLAGHAVGLVVISFSLPPKSRQTRILQITML